MKNLDPSSATGPDNITPFFYEEYTEELVFPIMKIWRVSLGTSLLPEGTAQPTSEAFTRQDPDFKTLPTNMREL